MKKILTLFVVLLCLQIQAQTDDPVIMTVAGKDITRSQFEYYLNKNIEETKTFSKTELDDYAEKFVNYRMKVQAALDAKFDTLTSFNTEYRQYRDAQLKPFLYDSIYVDSMAHEVYKSWEQQAGGKDLILVSHILISVSEYARADFKKMKLAKADSIYNVLKNGADFATIAKQFSDDKSTAKNGGKVSWLSYNSVLPEFRDVAFSMQPGELSKPFLSSAGYHIILMHERKPLEPFAEKRKEIINLLVFNGIKDQASEANIKKIVAKSNGKLTREDVMLETQREATKNNQNLKYLIDEYYDGLLSYEACDRLVWQAAAQDSIGLVKYFKKNKKNYTWTEPHFRGYVYQCKTEELKNKIEKIINKCKLNEGIALLKEKTTEKERMYIRMKYGVYQKGDNQIVDYLCFNSGEEPKTNKIYKLYGCKGKMLKQPKVMYDVKHQVVSDYKNLKEMEWIDALRQKYTYIINRDVLYSVNQGH